jgi:hypothetical protein
VNFSRGDFVRITVGTDSIDAMVMLASPNGKSLMLGFKGVLRSLSGGMFFGSIPVLLGDDGVYRDLADHGAVTIEPARPGA